MYDDYDEMEYRKQLGLVGIQMMQLAELGDDLVSERRGASYQEDDSPDFGFGGRRTNSLFDMEGDFESFVEAITAGQDEFAFNLVERMKSTTFKVRIMNALSDLIEPLVTRLDLSKADAEQTSIVRHHEIGMYLDRILQSVNNLDTNTDENRGFYLAAKEFFRHPELYIGLALMNATVGALKFGLGTLIGFKETKSDTDRIVDAINRQTEWHMTNAIEQRKGFFERLRTQGVLGMGIRGLGNLGLRALGVSRKKAQEQEDMRSEGTDFKRGFRGFFSDFFYGDEVTMRGRKGRSYRDDWDNAEDADFTEDDRRDSSRSVHDEMLFDMLKEQFEALNAKAEYLVRASGIFIEDLRDIKWYFGENQKKIEDQSIKTLLLPPPDSEHCCKGFSLDHLESSADATVENGRNLISLVDNIEEMRLKYTAEKDKIADSRYEDAERERVYTAARENTIIELMQDQRDGVFKVVKNTKATRDEVHRTRMQAMWGAVVGFGASLVSGVMGLLGSIGTVIAALLPLKVLGGTIMSVGTRIIAGISAAILGSKILRGRGGIGGVPPVGGLPKGAGGAPKVPTPVPVGGIGGLTPKGARLTLAGIASGMAVGVAKNFVDEDTKAYAGLDVLDSVMAGAGTGALGGSLFAGIGAIPGAIAGGAIGLANGLYNNYGTLFGADPEATEPPVEPLPKKVETFSPVGGEIVSPKTTTTGTPEGITQPTDINSLVRDKFDDVKTQFAPIQQQISQKASPVVEKTQPLIETLSPMTSRLIAASDDVTTKAMNVGNATAEFITEQADRLSPHFKAIEDAVVLQADVIKDAMDGVRKKTEENLAAVRENNKTSKEIVSVLKGILENTKQKASGVVEDSPFAGVTDGGFLRNLIGG